MKTADRKPPTPEEQKKAADAWNAAHPVGTVVEVMLDDGSKLQTKTESIATVLASGTAVVWVRGISGCYRLDRVKPVNDVRQRTALELLIATRQILAEYQTDDALQLQAKAIDDFFADPTMTPKPRPPGAMAVIIKDTSLLAGTIGNNVAALMTKAIDAADNPAALAMHESLATCLMLAIFEVFGVPAHSRIPAPDIMQKALNQMAVEFGLDEDTFTVKFWDTESEGKPS